MSTRTFLTPMTPDGKPGQLVQVQVNDEQQQYLTPDGKLVAVAVQSSVAAQQFAEPVPYFAANFPEVAELRTKVKQAETALRHAVSRNAPSKEIARLEGALRSMKAELDAAEQPKREERQRELTGVNTKTQTPNKMSWNSLLADLDSKQQAAQRATASSNVSNVCCSGEHKYKCSRCRATAGV